MLKFVRAGSLSGIVGFPDMTKRGRIILTALPLWALLAFVPLINTGPKVGWVQVWAAYPIFAGTILTAEWGDMLLMATLVIAAHLILSIFIAALVYCGVKKMRNEKK